LKLAAQPELWAQECPDVFSQTLAIVWRRRRGAPADALAKVVGSFLRVPTQVHVRDHDSGERFKAGSRGESGGDAAGLRGGASSSSGQVRQGAGDAPDADTSPPTNSETPAKIHPLEAQSIAQQQWATLVEHRASMASSVQPEMNIGEHVGVVLLTFSRRSQELSSALLNSGPAITAVANGIDVQPSWANGAKIFVGDAAPENFDEILNASHSVVYARDEPAIFEALKDLPWNVKKLKPGSGRAVVPGNLSLVDVSSDDDPMDVQAAGDVLEVWVKYGFIHVGTRAHWEDARSVWTI